jgi:hypothetical protein
MTTAEPLSFACPRCGSPTNAAYYGPCGACRDSLREAVAGEARDIEVAEYEPKMNVTPNAIAVKDD